MCARAVIYTYIYIHTRWKIALGRIWKFRSTRNDKHSAARRSSNVVPVASASGIYDNGISAGERGKYAPRGKYAHKGLERALTRSASRWPTFEFIKIHAKRIARRRRDRPKLIKKKKKRRRRKKGPPGKENERGETHAEVKTGL